MVPKLSEQSPHQSSTNHPTYTGLIPEPDGTKFMAAECPEGTAFRCTPVQLIPFPIPFGDTSFDRSGSNPFFQPIFYPQSSPPLWPSIFQKVSAENYPHQSGFDGSEACSLGIHGFQAPPRQEEEEEEEAEQVDEQRLASAVSGDSASVSNHSRYNLNENVSNCVSNENNGAFTTFNVCEASGRDDDGFQKFGETIKTVNSFQLSQREAALTKFRLKRKERCFEKKVCADFFI